MYLSIPQHNSFQLKNKVENKNFFLNLYLNFLYLKLKHLPYYILHKSLLQQSNFGLQDKFPKYHKQNFLQLVFEDIVKYLRPYQVYNENWQHIIQVPAFVFYFLCLILNSGHDFHKELKKLQHQINQQGLLLDEYGLELFLLHIMQLKNFLLQQRRDIQLFLVQQGPSN